MIEVDIQKVIDENSVAVWFQPIISVQRQSIQIIEALARGIDPSSGEIIYPKELFAAAEEAGCRGKLERLCLENTLRNFSKLQQKMPKMILSINIGNPLIHYMDCADWLPKLTESYNINPNRIILEVLESAIAEVDTYRQFLQHNREKGFLLALDDVGSQYSGLIRMSEIKPDLIKIDRKLISGLHKEKWRMEVVRALTGLAHRTGALVVAEGVEEIEEALECLALDVDFQQGFLYSRAHSFESGTDPNCQKAYELIANKFRSHSDEILRRRHMHLSKNSISVDEIREVLEKVSYADMEAALYWLTEKYQNLQFIYLLNENGITITDTVGRTEQLTEQKRYIFHPAKKGENLSLKEYYLWLKSGNDSYVSDAYISSATGAECITHSCRFRSADGLSCICCLDVSLEEIKSEFSFID